MNPKFSKIIMSVALVVLVLLLFVSIMSSGGNLVGHTALYMSVICFFIGLLTPQTASYLILFLAAYSDLIKRFLVLDTMVSQLDLVYVLAMAPLTLAGIVVSLLLGGIFKRSITRSDMVRFGVCSGVLLAVGVSVFLGGEGMRGLRVIADYGAFIYLYFALPILFSNRLALLKYARAGLIIFIPVAIYGIWQRIYGLSAFELDYLDTGLSTESRQLDDIAFRPFSTLNAASSLTMVCAASTMLSYVLMRAGLLLKFGAGVLMLLYSVACVMTFTRAGWVCGCIAPFVVLAFRYRVTTWAFYLGGTLAFLSVVIGAEWFMDNLQDWQAGISGEGDYGRSTQAFRVTTLYDRFLGFSNLKNPENWTPFGIQGETRYGEGRFDDTAFSHDAISSFIFNRGYVPAALGLVLGLVTIVKLHGTILSQKIQERKFSSLIVGSCAALLVSLLAGGYIFQFPANIFFWLMVCVAASSLKSEPELEQVEDDAGV